MSRMAVPRRRGGQETVPTATMTITATAKREFPTHPLGNSARAKVSKAATMPGSYRISEGRQGSPVTSVSDREVFLALRTLRLRRSRTRRRHSPGRGAKAVAVDVAEVAVRTAATDTELRHRRRMGMVRT